MPIRKILASITGRETGNDVLDVAGSLAHRFQAHVDAVLVRTDAKAIMQFLGEPLAAAVIEKMIQGLEKEAAAMAEQGKQRFDSWQKANHLSPVDLTSGSGAATAEWQDYTGVEADIIKLLGRLSDVVVVGRATEDSTGPSDLTVEAAVLATGRPTLVVPPHCVSTLRRVAIAWNGSAEASRAVAMGLPFLTSADKVSIITVEERSGMSDSARDLASYLRWHDIQATLEIAIPERGTGEVLLDTASRCGADLLVMGAYTHSRLREVIFGGATRYVLRSAEIPLLMTH